MKIVLGGDSTVADYPLDQQPRWAGDKLTKLSVPRSRRTQFCEKRQYDSFVYRRRVV